MKTILSRLRRVGHPLALVWCIAVSLLSHPAWGADTFGSTGSLVGARIGHTATRLLNGKVLVVGGDGNTPGTAHSLSSAELYDPSPGTWSTTGSLATERDGHTATLLPSGKVLVAGGSRNSGGSVSFLSSAEVYNPAGNGGAGSWNGTGTLATRRYGHTATLLPNGKVLVTGGNLGLTTLSSAELYDPAGNGGAGSWSTAGSLATARNGHTATLLPSGKVLVAGGYCYDFSANSNHYLSSAELYDPAGNGGAGSWSATGILATARENHTATLLANGKVLVAGGYYYDYVANSDNYLSSAELYDPVGNGGAGSWSATGILATARENHTATLLANGKVLVAGGYYYDYVANSDNYLSSAELYDPVGNGGAGSWSATGILVTARIGHTATLLLNGKVLVSGGFRASGSSVFFFSSAELYDPAGNGGAGNWGATGSLATARELHTATLLSNGKVLVAAGNEGSAYLVSAELYDWNPWTPLDWRQSWYGTTNNSGNAADTADPYNTGIQNLAVFAFLGPNQNPTSAKISQLPQVQNSGGSIFYNYAQPTGVTGITYGAEWRPTLTSGSWQPITDSGNGAQHIFSVPIGSNTQIFMRLVVPSP